MAGGGGRVLVNEGELINEISSKNKILESIKEWANAVKTQLQAFSRESGLTGNAYDNAKTYYETTYVSLLDEVVSACDDMIGVNNTIIPTFSAYVTDSSGYGYDTDVLEAEIDRLESEILNYEGLIQEYQYLMECALSYDPTAGGGYYYSGIITWYSGMVEYDRDLKAKLQGIVDSLRMFDGACSGIYDGVGTFLYNLSSAISSLNTSIRWNGSAGRYNISSDLEKILAEIEYGKMMNPDGTLNTVYLKELMGKSPEDLPDQVYDMLIDVFMGLSLGEKEKFLECSYILLPDSCSPDPNVFQGVDSGSGSYEYRISGVYVEACSRFYRLIDGMRPNANSVAEDRIDFDFYSGCYSLMAAAAEQGGKVYVRNTMSPESGYFAPLDIKLKSVIPDENCYCIIDYFMDYNGSFQCLDSRGDLIQGKQLISVFNSKSRADLAEIYMKNANEEVRDSIRVDKREEFDDWLQDKVVSGVEGLAEKIGGSFIELDEMELLKIGNKSLTDIGGAEALVNGTKNLIETGGELVDINIEANDTNNALDLEGFNSQYGAILNKLPIMSANVGVADGKCQIYYIDINENILTEERANEIGCTVKEFENLIKDNKLCEIEGIEEFADSFDSAGGYSKPDDYEDIKEGNNVR